MMLLNEFVDFSQWLPEVIAFAVGCSFIIMIAVGLYLITRKDKPKHRPFQMKH